MSNELIVLKHADLIPSANSPLDSIVVRSMLICRLARQTGRSGRILDKLGSESEPSGLCWPKNSSIRDQA